MKSFTMMPQDTPERIFLAVDTECPTGEAYAQYGEPIRGTVVVEEEHIPGEDHCEMCGDADGRAYKLVNERYGVPVCLDCLAGSSWIDRVENTREVFEPTPLVDAEVSQ
ncbi:hypothetical protein HSRCO_0758 [Halanaeroarchaeum sp. HSR-CO]|uniref:hypothetical protein n=1 Tax=Halanaeroarchaeum sp. HSR-CO TaxID=2866382 RepID=UPI00217D4DB8|nr:hypothetical protein [Halanaeroarchaeum sp. HSR-CO]UWG47052.1 hypothetical protein HSRCO_0758 [Halanaeroarchaeum sp. HSR-CO]